MMANRFLFSFPFGNNNSYHAALALWETGQLRDFYTYVLRKSGDARAFPQLRGAPIRCLYGEELVRIICTRLPVVWRHARSSHWINWTGRRFDERVAARVSNQYTHIYGYEDFCATSFERAKEAGVRCVYELPIAFFREGRYLLNNARQKDASLAPFFENLSEPEWKIERKLQELSLADQIVVASSFSYESVRRHLPELGNRIVKVPYGANVPVSAPQPKNGCPLKILFVGIIGPRKGVHHLFAALSAIRSTHVQLTMAGPWVAGFRKWLSDRYDIPYTYLGRVPHSGLPEVYANHDILALPSLFEGFGMVILEAMAHGTPVIATERTGAPDIYTHGEGGLTVRADDESALTTQIEQLIDDRPFLQHLGQRAFEIAREHSWERYRLGLMSAIAGIACPPTHGPILRDRREHSL